MDVSIIIVNYNTVQLTNDCVNSIVKHTNGINYEIIVVDNGSTDGSKELFESRTDIKYLYSDVNLGFGKANNLGVNIASGKYLFFLNSDTLLISNAVLQLFNDMVSNPRIAVLGAQLLYPDNSLQESYFEFPSLKLIMKDCLGLINHLPTNHDNDDSIVNLNNKFISGADLFISRVLYDKVEGFYPGYFMYYEETDLQYNIIKDSNLTIAFDPNIKIVHYNGGSQLSKENNEQLSKLKYSQKITIFNKSRILYFRRNISQKVFFLKIILSIGILLRGFRLYGGIMNHMKVVWNS